MHREPKILYVDDELDLVQLAQSFFEEENMHIDIATDFDLALEQIRNNFYDIIITDAKMPKGSGFDLIKAVKAEGKFLGKFILVTGNIESTDIKNSGGFDLVIYKPVHFEELVDRVKGLFKF